MPEVGKTGFEKGFEGRFHYTLGDNSKLVHKCKKQVLYKMVGA